jgi:hypothetical protein
MHQEDDRCFQYLFKSLVFTKVRIINWIYQSIWQYIFKSFKFFNFTMHFVNLWLPLYCWLVYWVCPCLRLIWLVHFTLSVIGKGFISSTSANISVEEAAWRQHETRTHTTTNCLGDSVMACVKLNRCQDRIILQSPQHSKIRAHMWNYNYSSYVVTIQWVYLTWFLNP